MLTLYNTVNVKGRICLQVRLILIAKPPTCTLEKARRQNADQFRSAIAAAANSAMQIRKLERAS